jgi:hypothetical protein
VNKLNESFVVDLTDEQHELLEPYIFALRPGETLVAQVFGDGMRVKKLTPDQSVALSIALSGRGHIHGPESNSAHEAQALATCDKRHLQ